MPLDWTDHLLLPAAPHQDPCLPLIGSVGAYRNRLQDEYGVLHGINVAHSIEESE